MLVDKVKCIGCKTCNPYCTVGAISIVEWEGKKKSEVNQVECVECGACNMICPTCHCFLLVDQSADDKFQRLKVWDSCLMKRFARVAGGANPRKHLGERLRNRFIKKFDFFPEILGIYACTGCGRCIETCLGDIDIREVLKESCKAAK